MGAHHQNRITEQAIQTILSKVCTILIHATTQWPQMANRSLWLMAGDYMIHHHNHMPHEAAGSMSLLELIMKTKVSWTHFQDMHIWACSCYMLESTWQYGHKLPKWKPCSCHTIFIVPHLPLILHTKGVESTY